MNDVRQVEETTLGGSVFQVLTVLGKNEYRYTLMRPGGCMNLLGLLFLVLVSGVRSVVGRMILTRLFLILNSMVSWLCNLRLSRVCQLSWFRMPVTLVVRL